MLFELSILLNPGAESDIVMKSQKGEKWINILLNSY